MVGFEPPQFLAADLQSACLSVDSPSDISLLSQICTRIRDVPITVVRAQKNLVSIKAHQVPGLYADVLEGMLTLQTYCQKGSIKLFCMP